ncbi:MAG: hypothetical protein COA73_01730 [Candidatus Hydrogenedentota bacterium]|nr:MAG: hypothetical protein COA73_01730 [Candidatus Hydrogenedentota bacterium]
MTNTPRRVCVTTILLSLITLSAYSDAVSDKGREIFEAHKSAVVTVQVVMKMKFSFPGMGSQEDESKSEVTGTVISEDGLTLVSLSETDPTSLIKNMMAGQAGMENMQMETEIRDVKILTADGTEIPAEIILRDKDLDMAFVRPTEKPSTPMDYISLENPGEPDYLDQIVTINQLGKVARRTHSVSLERIQAIVTKPRTFYLPGNDPSQTGLGSPAFTLDGNLIGVFLLRSIKSTGGSAMSMLGGMQDNVMAIIVPAADIQDAASQAPPLK